MNNKAKENQNKLLKIMLIISLFMLLTGIYDCVKALRSPDFAIDKIKEVIDIYLNTSNDKIDTIINAGSTVYVLFRTLNAVIIHVSKTLINILTLTILSISRLVLNGNITKTRYNISKVINFIALLVLFNLVLLLFEINVADLSLELVDFNIIMLFKMIIKLIDMGLFILEMWVIIKYTF